MNQPVPAGYTLDDYLMSERPAYSITEEEEEQLRVAMCNLRDLCIKLNVPMVGAVSVGSDDKKFNTRCSSFLPIDRSPVEFLMTNITLHQSVHAGVEFGLTVIEETDPLMKALLES